MERTILNYLLKWKDQQDRLPLLLRGARQVGKTYIIDHFGQIHFQNVVKINFEQQREFIACFNTLYPEKILQLIYAISGQSVKPGSTLLFLDEIQECPQAIVALRYFYEQLPQLHVVAAGSLLEFTLNQPDFRMPVGRVQSYYLKPLSFREFLICCGKSSLVEYIQSITLHTGIDFVIHEQLLTHLKEYLVLGGMPAVIKNYLQEHDFAESQIRQSVILETYRNDFAKYAKNTDIKYLQAIFEKAPGMISKHFKYVDVDPHMHPRDLKRAINDLKNAGVLYTNHACSANGLPLITTMNEKKFKLLFLDVGLINSVTRLSAEILLGDNLMLLHQGAIVEQFVGQELLAYSQPFREEKLFYWEREKSGSSAEIDYVVAFDSKIIPVEVKAGATGRLRSIQLFLDEKKCDIGLRISQKTLGLSNRILSIPLYMISELERLLGDMSLE